jgi:putative peptidoglycan lipid II flippase
MFLLLIALNLLIPLQRMVASAFEAAGAAQLDYAARGLQVVLQMLVGGLAMASLADWSRPGQGRRVRVGVSRATALAALLLVVSGSVIVVSAQPLVATLLERGAFDAADTRTVSTLLIILVPGFVAEGLAVVLSQGLLAIRFTRLFLRVNAIRFALHLVLIVVLGQAWGVVGVAAAYVIALVATLVMTIVGAAQIGLFRGNASLLARTAAAATLIGTTAVTLAPLGESLAILSTIGVLAVATIAFVMFRLGELLPAGWIRGMGRPAGERAA